MSKIKDNCTFLQLYTFFLYKIKKFFLFFLKPWYNWYNLKKCYVSTVIRSNLYQTPLVQLGTIGTIVKKASNTNEIGGRAHDFYIYLLLIQKGVYRNS